MATEPSVAGFRLQELEGLVLAELGEMGIVTLNEQHASLDDLLKESNTLSLFPLIGGG